MIIKSMSRKESSFAQLIDYLNRDSAKVEDFELYHNLFAREQDSLVDEFESNAAFLKKRKNGNFMYHEILSVSPSGQLSRDEQKEILREIAQKYIEERARYNLVYAVLHDDHEHHLHYHFLMSANEMRDQKRTRFSKTKFDKLKKDLEHHVLQHYPEMEQQKLIGKIAKQRVSQKELAMKRRTGKPSQKDMVRDSLKDIFEMSANASDFYKTMDQAGFTLYQRGKVVGVKVSGQKNPHRLQTLGVLAAWQDAQSRLGVVIGERPKAKAKENPAEKQKKTSTGFSQQRKTELAEILKGIFEHSRSAAEIVAGLKRYNLSIVERDGYLGVKDLATGKEIALRDLTVGVRKEAQVKDGLLHHEVTVKYVDENLRKLYEDSKKRIWLGKDSQKPEPQTEKQPDGMFGRIGKVFKAIVPGKDKQDGDSGLSEDKSQKEDFEKDEKGRRQADISEGKISDEVRKRRGEMARFRDDLSDGKSRDDDHDKDR